MIATACGAMLAQALIPLITGRIIDGPISHHDTAGIWPLAGLALAFGLAEAVLFFARRYAMALGALGIETDMRRDLFAHLQRLPVAFHDRWASGQLLSRASTDLSTIRRFIGFGFVFLVANTVTTLVVLGLLLSIDPPLGLLVVLAIAPLALFTRKFELRYSRDARRVQDLTGDLATSVEESALGIRVIKSYGRRPQMLGSFTKDATVRRRAGRSARHDDAGAARRVPHAVSATHLADHLAGLAARDHRGSGQRLAAPLRGARHVAVDRRPAAARSKAT